MDARHAVLSFLLVLVLLGNPTAVAAGSFSLPLSSCLLLRLCQFDANWSIMKKKRKSYQFCFFCRLLTCCQCYDEENFHVVRLCNQTKLIIMGGCMLLFSCRGLHLRCYEDALLFRRHMQGELLDAVAGGRRSCQRPQLLGSTRHQQMHLPFLQKLIFTNSSRRFSAILRFVLCSWAVEPVGKPWNPSLLGGRFPHVWASSSYPYMYGKSTQDW